MGAGRYSAPNLAQLTHAVYTATLSDDALVAGQATLEIKSVDKRPGAPAA